MKIIKHLIILFVLISSITACDSSQSHADKKKLTDVTFSTEINLTKTDWKLGETYKDTLEFISFDSNYDYWYGLFKTTDGHTVSLVYDKEIDAKLEHSLFAIEWMIDSLSEAGEQEAKYYDERLISFNVVEQSQYFGDYLAGFLSAYSSEDTIAIHSYINKEVGFYTTFNPGLYCVIQQQNRPQTKNFIELNCKILDDKLLGNFCDGYPNIEDGLYFESITYDKIPTYESPVEEHVKEYWIPLREELHTNEFKKVTIVKEENQYVQLYFIRLDKQWYLWAEDLCDCSA